MVLINRRRFRSFAQHGERLGTFQRPRVDSVNTHDRRFECGPYVLIDMAICRLLWSPRPANS